MNSTAAKRLLKITLPVLATLVVVGGIFLATYRPNYYKEAPGAKEITSDITQIQSNTTRIATQMGDPIKRAVAISQTVYPATFKDNKPRAVILVRADRQEEAVVANGLIHHPIDAPILYVEADHLPETTAHELKRLAPEGVSQDGDVQVYLVGEISPEVKREVEALQFKTRTFQAENVFELARLIDQYGSVMHANHIDDVIIVQSEELHYALPALSWRAHMSVALLFVDGEEIPPATVKALEERPQDAFIYLMGPPTVISEEVAQKLVQFGHVQRIPGNDAFEVSVGFAGYKDMGPNFGWWIDKSPRSFGWGIAEAGHNVILGNYSDWQGLVPASILSHRGKHGPMLLLHRNKVPDPVKKYLETLQPSYVGAQEQLFNHGWVIGDESQISDQTWHELNKLLQVKWEGVQ